MQWPRHECSLSLTHNQHKDYYMTVAQAVDERDHGYGSGTWISEEQKQKAIETNECWTLQWYPQTPVSCFIVTACDLDALMEFVMQQEAL